MLFDVDFRKKTWYFSDRDEKEHEKDLEETSESV